MSVDSPVVSRGSYKKLPLRKELAEFDANSNSFRESMDLLDEEQPLIDQVCNKPGFSRIIDL